MDKNISISKPGSPDKSFLIGLTSAVINSRIVIIGLILMLLLMSVTLLVVIKQPKIVAVIDNETGQTFATTSQMITKNVIKRQIMYYSKTFCEDYLSLDHQTVVESRKRALAAMHPKMVQDIAGEKYYESKDVIEAIQQNFTCTYEWIRYPVITIENHPRYTAFCQFKRVLTKRGYKPIEETFNIKIDWAWLINNPDPFKRPNDLLCIEFKELQENSTEFKDQLNLSYQTK